MTREIAVQVTSQLRGALEVSYMWVNAWIRESRKTRGDRCLANAPEPAESQDSLLQRQVPHRRKYPAQDNKRSANSKEDGSSQVRREGNDLFHISQLLQATDTPEVSPSHHTAKHSPLLIRKSAASSFTRSHRDEPLADCMSHFTVLAQKLFLFHFILLS